MAVQPYCMIQMSTNICDNITLWDGNPATWSPPPGYLMLVQATTLAKVWSWNETEKVYQLVVEEGQGQIGFTWDGTYLTTNQPAPPIPEPTTVSGAQTL